VRLRSTRNDAAALTCFLLTLFLSAASFLNSLGVCSLYVKHEVLSYGDFKT
jgi:hypothetical protein